MEYAAFIFFCFVGLIVLAKLISVALDLERKEKSKASIAKMWERTDTARAEREKRLGIYEDAGIFLGYRSAYLTDDESEKRPLRYNGDRHIMTFGPIGSGKGATVLISALVDGGTMAKSSALVIDVKGQLAAVTAQIRAAWGQTVYCINPFDVLSIPTATYNPLRFVNPGSVSFASDCKRIAEGLGFEGADNSSDKNAFFEMTALDLVNVLVQWAVVYAGKPGWEEYEPNLITIRKVLNLGEPHRSDFFRALTGLPNAAIAEGAQMFVAPEGGQLRGAIEDCFSTARGKLAFLRDPGVEKVLSGGKNEISFADLKRKLMTVYLVIPPELLGTHGRFLRLLVMSAMNELFRERTQPENPVVFLLDEFAQLGYMSLIENVASVGRDYKIRLWCILQNIPQLKNLYGSRWESFLSSAGVAQFFAPNDVETAAWIGKRSGTRTVQKKTVSTSKSSGNSKPQDAGLTNRASGSESSGETTGTSISEVEEPRLKQGEIIGLDPHRQLIFVPNTGSPVHGRRFPYYADNFFESLRPWIVKDPYHMTDAELAAFTASLPGSCLDPAAEGEKQKIVPTLGQ